MAGSQNRFLVLIVIGIAGHAAWPRRRPKAARESEPGDRQLCINAMTPIADKLRTAPSATNLGGTCHGSAGLYVCVGSYAGTRARVFRD